MANKNRHAVRHIFPMVYTGEEILLAVKAISKREVSSGASSKAIGQISETNVHSNLRIFPDGELELKLGRGYAFIDVVRYNWQTLSVVKNRSETRITYGEALLRWLKANVGC